MLSLLLTLFISLFSVGSSINSIEDHHENDVILQESKPVYNVVTNMVDYGEIYRFYSINDLTSYDVMTNMYNYDLNHGNFFHTGQQRFTFTPQDINANYIVDGGDTAHYDFTGFELKYRISGCTFEWSESPYRIVLKADFTIVGLNSTTSLGHFQVDNVRYKFNGVLNQSTCSYFHDTNDTGLQLLLNSSFYIRCLQTSQTYNLFDFLGDGNFATYDDAYQSGQDIGKQIGYQEGLAASNNYDPVASSILNGIFDIGLLPVNVFLTIFDFELFGVNIAGIVSGLLTLSVVIIVLRFLLGGKKDD